MTEADVAVIGRPASVLTTVAVDGADYRVRTIGFPRCAVQVGRSLAETNNLLRSIRTMTLLIGTLVTALAGGVGLWIADRVTASLRRLTGAAERVEATGRVDAGLDIPTTRGGHLFVDRLALAQLGPTRSDDWVWRSTGCWPP